MMRAAGLIVALALLVLAPGAAAQEGSPFGPLAPAAPPEEPAQPAPQPLRPAPPVVQPEEDSLGAAETLPLLAMSVLLFVAVGVAIARDARRPPVRRKKTLTRRSPRPNRSRVRSSAR